MPSLPDICRRHLLFSLHLLALLLFLLPLAATLPIHELDKDELTTSWVTRMEVSDLTANRLANGHPPLYFLAAKGWAGLWGHSAFSLISFSLLQGMAVVFLMMAVGRELGFGKTATTLLLLLAAAHPTLQFFASYVRPYIGALALHLALLWLCQVYLKKPRPSLWFILLGLILVGAAWNHLLALAWLGLFLASLCLPHFRRKAGPAYWLLFPIAAGAHAFWIILCARKAGGTKPLDWIEGPDHFLEGANRIFSLWGYGYAKIDNLNEQALLPWVTVASLCWAAIWLSGKKGGLPWKDPGFLGPPVTENLPLRANLAFLLMTSLLPVGLLALVTLAGRPLLLPRYLSLFLPGFLLLTALFLSRLGPGRLIMGIMAILLALSIIGSYKQWSKKVTGLRKAMTLLDEKGNPALDGILLFRHQTAEALTLYSSQNWQWAQVAINTKEADVEKRLRPFLHNKEKLWIILPEKYQDRELTQTAWWRENFANPDEIHETAKYRLILQRFTSR